MLLKSKEQKTIESLLTDEAKFQYLHNFMLEGLKEKPSRRTNSFATRISSCATPLPALSRLSSR